MTLIVRTWGDENSHPETKFAEQKRFKKLSNNLRSNIVERGRT